MGYKIIRPRRGIKSLWDAYKDKIYKTGEMLVESPESGVGTGPVNVKFGDGMTPYYALPYAIEAPINQAIEGSTKPITSGAVYEQNKNLANDEIIRTLYNGACGNESFLALYENISNFKKVGCLLKAEDECIVSQVELNTEEFKKSKIALNYYNQTLKLKRIQYVDDMHVKVDASNTNGYTFVIYGKGVLVN